MKSEDSECWLEQECANMERSFFWLYDIMLVFT